MNESRLEYLFERYLSNECSEDEMHELIQWLEANENEESVKNVIDKLMNTIPSDLELPEYNAKEILHRIIKTGKNKYVSNSGKRKVFLIWSKAIAAVIIGLAIGWYLIGGHNNNKVAKAEKPVIENTVIRPGGDKALLTLSDGTVIDLNEMPNGVLDRQSGYVIEKEGGVLRYDLSNAAAKVPAGSGFNILSTPRGGQFQLTLPDGSKVWLNAESSLKFPATFSAGVRQVEVIGEAYFEIKTLQSSKGKVPFEVLVTKPSGKRLKVQVLGTHFNVNAYQNESMVRTTLIEGSVKLTAGDGVHDNSVMLKPGQQAKLQEEGLMEVDKYADVESVIAWKNGLFQFDNVDISTIMRQIGRWYDVDIKYGNDVPQRHFVGKIRRSAELQDVLEILKLSDINFRVDGKTIIVN